MTRSVILSLKRRNSPATAYTLAVCMVEAAQEALSELLLTKNFVNPLIIPIPATREKIHLHGFNHAEVLAKEFVSLLGELEPQLATTILLKKNTSIKQAKTKNRSERFANISRAFYLENTHLIQDRCIILIDDVTTTGATFGAASQLLLETGARNVLCIAAAH